jgi:hypothetical protein
LSSIRKTIVINLRRAKSLLKLRDQGIQGLVWLLLHEHVAAPGQERQLAAGYRLRDSLGPPGRRHPVAVAADDQGWTLDFPGGF